MSHTNIFMNRNIHKKNMCNLTGLFSRDYLIEILEKEKKNQYLLAIVDIDEFSSINNMYGLKIANKLLLNIAESLSISLDNFKIFRIQADEFVLLKKIKDEEDLKVSINKVKNVCRQNISSEYVIEKENIAIETTLGISSGKSADLLRNALLAYQEAKRTNKRSFFYIDSLSKIIKDQKKTRNIAEIIRSAIKNNQVIPAYQQIIDNKTKKVYKYEALVRIKYGKKLISPFLFIDIARKIKLYHEITLQMVNTVFKDVYEENIICAASINLNIEDVENKKTVEIIEKNLKKYGGEKVTFEIVETVGVSNYAVLRSFIQLVKKYGSSFAIDDFGTGHSGYEHLVNLDVDYIKIDGIFIKEIKTSEKIRILLKGIILYTNSFNLKTIAEFVEDEETFQILKNLGIDYSQGYYFDKPKTIDEIKKGLK